MNTSFAAHRHRWQASLMLLVALVFADRVHGAVRGELDATFGDNGRMTIGGNVDITLGGAVAQQLADGKLLVAGASVDASSLWFDLIVLRLNSDGSADGDFGADGAVLIDFAELREFATDLAVQSDGKILVAGYAETAMDNFDFALVRLNQDGSLDPTFGTGGRVTLGMGGGKDYIAKMILLPDGKIVVAGATNVGGDYDAVFARFEANGSLDATFGTGPVAGVTVIGSGSGQDQPYWMTRQPDGKFVACGHSGPRAYDPVDGQMMAVRVNADGSVDGAFGANGISLVSTGEPLGGARGCVTLPGGNTVLAGFAGTATNADLLFARLTSNGQRDSTFGNGGISRIDLGGSESAQSIIRLSDGKLAVTGLTGLLNSEYLSVNPLFGYDIPSDYSDALLVLIDPESGSLDSGFGNDGVTFIDFGRQNVRSLAFGRGLIEQADGKLLTVGASAEWGDWWNYHRIALARVDPVGGGNAGIASFVVGGTQVTEGDAEVTLRVRRTGGSTGDLSIDYTTVPNSAIAPGDFTETSGTLTWLSGDTDPKVIRVPISNDAAIENFESFTVELSSSGNHVGFATSWVGINDNDEAIPPPSPPIQPGPQGGGGAANIETLLMLAMIWTFTMQRRRRGRSRPSQPCAG